MHKKKWGYMQPPFLCMLILTCISYMLHVTSFFERANAELQVRRYCYLQKIGNWSSRLRSCGSWPSYTHTRAHIHTHTHMHMHMHMRVPPTRHLSHSARPLSHSARPLSRSTKPLPMLHVTSSKNMLHVIFFRSKNEVTCNMHFCACYM